MCELARLVMSCWPTSEHGYRYLLGGECAVGYGDLSAALQADCLQSGLLARFPMLLLISRMALTGWKVSRMKPLAGFKLNQKP